MPKFTPAELSRMKAEKDARDAHELMMNRKRQDELRQMQLQQARLQQQGGGAQAVSDRCITLGKVPRLTIR